MEDVMYIIVGFVSVPEYNYFKRLLVKHVSNWYLLRIISLLLCIGLNVVIIYIIKCLIRLMAWSFY